MIDTVEPTEIVAGDTVSWKVSEGDYPAPTWTLTYSLLKKDCDKIEITASDNGDLAHLVTIDAANSVDWEAGDYHWQKHFTNGATRRTVASGWLTVKPNYAAGKIDPRSSVKRTLDALEAVRENKATGDQLSMSIQGRSISRMSWQEVNDAYDHFSRLFSAEVASEKAARGISDQSGRVKVTFDNA